MSDQETGSANVLPMAIGFEAGLTLVALALGWVCRVEPLATLVWNPRDLAWGLIATLPLFAALATMVRFPVGPIGGLMEIVDELVLKLFQTAGIAEMAVISLLAGISEELLFRGAVQTTLSKWTGSPWIALAVAGALFGLVHSISRTYAMLAATVGIYFGWLWLATGNLLTPIVTHAVYDFGALWFFLHRAERRSTADR